MVRQPRSQRVEAVVLRHGDWGEADRLLTLYTRQQGKQRALAKGARRSTSRKAGHLEPFTHVSLQLARGRDLWIVTQAETIEAFQPLREDLLRTGYASYVIELIDRFVYEEEGPVPAVFTLLVETLGRLCTEAALSVTVRFYEVRLLDHLGFRPQLFECATCRREIRAEDQFFSAQAGGVVCPNCGGGLAGAWPVSVEALKYLRHFQRSSYAEARRARLDEAVQAELERLMNHYLTYVLERGLNTPEFIRRVRK